MADYKRMYSDMARIVEMYQDEIVPGFRAKIEELEVELAAVKRERDAMRYDMQNIAFGLCGVCKYNKPAEEECSRSGLTKHCFVWRGLCYENGGADNAE